jgi:hypothetical protein
MPSTSLGRLAFKEWSERHNFGKEDFQTVDYKTQGMQFELGGWGEDWGELIQR